MGEGARVVYLPEPEEVEIRSFPLPRIGHGEGLLRVELGGVCGTDVKIWHGLYGGKIAYPLIPGHEICGVIEEVGEEAARLWGVAEGDRVAVDSFLACGRCEACLAGQSRYCETLGDYGLAMPASLAPHLWGGFAEYVYLPAAAQVHKLPPGMSPELGVLVPAVVSNALRWLDDIGGATVGSKVHIIGPGPIGLAAVFVARALGAELVTISGLESDSQRLQFAARLGADHILPAGEGLGELVTDLTGGTGADIVLDVSGAPQALAQAPELVCRQGTIVAAGVNGGRATSLVTDDLVIREIRLLSAFSHDRAAVQRALSMVSRAEETFEEFVSHRFGLADYRQAVEAVETAHGDVVKVVIDPTLGNF